MCHWPSTGRQSLGWPVAADRARSGRTDSHARLHTHRPRSRAAARARVLSRRRPRRGRPRHARRPVPDAGEEISCEKTSHVPVAQHIPVRPVGLMGRGGGHGWSPRTSGQRWPMISLRRRWQRHGSPATHSVQGRILKRGYSRFCAISSIRIVAAPGARPHGMKARRSGSPSPEANRPGQCSCRIRHEHCAGCRPNSAKL